MVLTMFPDGIDLLLTEKQSMAQIVCDELAQLTWQSSSDLFAYRLTHLRDLSESWQQIDASEKELSPTMELTEIKKEVIVNVSKKAGMVTRSKTGARPSHATCKKTLVKEKFQSQSKTPRVSSKRTERSSSKKASHAVDDEPAGESGILTTYITELMEKAEDDDETADDDVTSNASVELSAENIQGFPSDSESSNQTNYRCTECDLSFNILSALYRHMHVHADDSKSSDSSPMPPRQKASEGHVCKVCGRAFTSMLKLHIHRRIHRSFNKVARISKVKIKQERGGDCSMCDRSFRYKRCLVKHTHQHGKQRESLGNIVATWLQSDPTLAEEISNTKSFHCTECVLTFNNIDELCGHVRIHCIRTDKQLLPIQVGNFKCNICDRQFLFESDLAVHCAENAEAHECLECGRRIGSALYLRIHRLAHKDQPSVPGLPVEDSSQTDSQPNFEVPHVRPICSSVIKRAEHMRQHMAVHSGDKKHICHVCAKQFMRKGQLKRHLLIHDGERQFECAKCGKRFLLRDMLRRHLRAVHERQRPHLCSLCGRPFAEKHQLRTHMKVHSRNPST